MPAYPHQGRTAWVLGGGSGIGQGIALGLAEAGAEVWLSGRRVSRLEMTASKPADPSSMHVLPCDATDYPSLEQAVRTIAEASGSLDTLVVSIGRAVAGSLEDTSLEDWHELSFVHLGGMFQACKAALPLLKQSGKDPNILIVGSAFGLKGVKNRLAYCTVKGGVANFVRALSLDLAGSVRVNGLCPGWVKTDMSMSIVESSLDPTKALEERNGWHPMNRGGSVEEVGGMAVFLTSAQAAWMTGQNVALDGGMTA